MCINLQCLQDVSAMFALIFHVCQIKKFRKKTLQRMANKFIRLHVRARAHLLCLEKHDPYINPLSVKVKLGLPKSQTYTKQQI
jgi:hypothetical protein